MEKIDSIHLRLMCNWGGILCVTRKDISYWIGRILWAVGRYDDNQNKFCHWPKQLLCHLTRKKSREIYQLIKITLIIVLRARRLTVRHSDGYHLRRLRKWAPKPFGLIFFCNPRSNFTWIVSIAIVAKLYQYQYQLEGPSFQILSEI